MPDPASIVNQAAAPAGGWHRIRFDGTVVHGNKRGRVLGFPTANIVVGAHAADLPDGVYACHVSFPPNPGIFEATVSVGNNPTFGDVGETRIEAYIHDFDSDLYGCSILVQVKALLRPTERFETVEELIRQTANDVECSKRILKDCAANRGVEKGDVL